MGSIEPRRSRWCSTSSTFPPAWPAGARPCRPVAVLAGLEVLLLQVRRAAGRQPTAAPPPPPVTTPAASLQPAQHPAAIPQPEGADLPSQSNREAAVDPTDAGPAPVPREPASAAVPASLPGMPAAGSAEAAARQLYDQLTAAGQRVTGAALGRAIGRSERYGRLLLADFRAQDQGSDRRDGDGAAAHKQAGPMPP
jgi:hypothetical protein